MSAILLLLVSMISFSQEFSVEDYIKTYSTLAIEEMKEYSIPASITLAQGILESGAGNSELAVKANNHFGIKCHKEWNGKTFHMDDDRKDECFRKYNSPEESYRDHSLFLTSRDRYDFLFLLDMKDYRSWAFGLKQAGYATNPRYPEMLIRIIEENQLQRFDRGTSEAEQLAAGNQQEALNMTMVEDGYPFEANISGQGGNGRDVYLNNRVKFIFSRDGDTWQGIAEEFGIYGWQVRKYNEMDRKEKIIPGKPVYLEPKRKKAYKDNHIVGPGESMKGISQRYAVKLKVLCRINGLKPGEEVLTGTDLKLR